MAKYNYEYDIKYQEVDGKKKLRLFNLENYLLEVAGKVADDLDFGIAKLHPMGLTWILTRLSVEMFDLPTHGEHVRFETWIESNAHMLSTRDFRIYSGERLIGQCKSVWAVLIGTKTTRLPNALLPTARISSWTNGTPLSSASMERKITAS